MNQPLRVLQIMGNMNRGGAETFVMNVYRELDRDKIQFDFVVHTKDQSDYDTEIMSMGGRIFHAPDYSGSNHFEYCSWWHNFFMMHREYKVVHSHVRSTASIIFKIAKRYDVYTIAHSHSTSNGKGISSVVKKALQRGIVKYADSLMACSYESGRWLYNTDSFITIKNGVPLSHYAFDLKIRSSYRNEMDIDDDTTVYGHVGRFHEAKNHIFLIDIFSCIHSIEPRSKLLLIGDGPLREKVLEQIKKHDLEESVLLLGVRTDIPQLLQAIDCFVFPSKWEGIPLSLIEAEASGVPCVVSDSISSEVLIVPNIVQMSITKTSREWADSAVSIEKDRKDNAVLLRRAGYDMTEEVKYIQDYYMDCSKK